MSPETRILNGLALTLVVSTLLGATWVAVRARRKGTDLGPGFAPQVVLLVGVLLMGMGSFLPANAPAWLRYGLLGASLCLAAVATQRLWRINKRRLRDVGLMRPK